ncbi:hypothetical protein [Cellulomonas sp.]|uniref:hypothetical protein n=1 Tax=Cellulomonas sp. TaxID=40001 RepID=UPI003BAA8B36
MSFADVTWGPAGWQANVQVDRFGDVRVITDPPRGDAPTADSRPVLRVGGVAVAGDHPPELKNGPTHDAWRAFEDYPWQQPFRVAVTALPAGTSDDRVLEQRDVWVDASSRVHLVGDMSTAHLANALLYLERNAARWLTGWKASRELAGDPLPLALGPLLRSDPTGVGERELMRAMPVYLAMESELARRLAHGQPVPAFEWWGSLYSAVEDAHEEWARRAPGCDHGFLDLAWHVHHRQPPVTLVAAPNKIDVLVGQVGAAITLHLTIDGDAAEAIVLEPRQVANLFLLGLQLPEQDSTNLVNVGTLTVEPTVAFLVGRTDVGEKIGLQAVRRGITRAITVGTKVPSE